jgi:hypothetical protein
MIISIRKIAPGVNKFRKNMDIARNPAPGRKNLPFSGSIFSPQMLPCRNYDQEFIDDHDRTGPATKAREEGKSHTGGCGRASCGGGGFDPHAPVGWRRLQSARMTGMPHADRSAQRIAANSWRTATTDPAGSPVNSPLRRPTRWPQRRAIGILQAGGSAADAAVAIQMVLTLVEPQSSGIGGGAFVMHWDGDRVTAYNGRESAPATGRRGPVPGPAGGQPLPHHRSGPQRVVGRRARHAGFAVAGAPETRPPALGGAVRAGR